MVNTLQKLLLLIVVLFKMGESQRIYFTPLRSTPTAKITPAVMDNLINIVDRYFFPTPAFPTPLFRVEIRKLLRAAFHDCMGGCDGSLNLNNTDNRGLESLMGVLNISYSNTPNKSPNYTYISTYLSRADFFVLMQQRALAWSMKNGGESPKFTNTTPVFKYGRIQNPNGPFNDQIEGKFPDGRANWTVPSTDKNHPTTVLEGLLTGLPGVTQTDIVTLLGLHGAGGLNMNNSGFQGPWLQFPNGTDIRNIVNNVYYKALYAYGYPNATMTQLPSNQGQPVVPGENYTSPPPEFNKLQWFNRLIKVGGNPGPGKVFLNVDLAIYHNFTATSNGSVTQKFCTQGANTTLYNCNAKNSSYLPLSPRAAQGYRYAQNNTAFINDLVPSFQRLVSVKVSTDPALKSFYPQITCVNKKQVCSGDIFFTGCGVVLGSCV